MKGKMVLVHIAVTDGRAEDWISDVDTEKREIRMRLPEGLLDL